MAIQTTKTTKMGELKKVTDDQTTKENELNLKLGNAIRISVEIDSIFRLYTYRVVTPEHFIKEVNKIVK